MDPFHNPEISLIQFIKKFDYKDSIVLLEGKRDVKEEDQALLYRLGMKLAASTMYMTFRSGNASGSDYYFSEGVAKIDPDRLQLVTPYTGHRKSFSKNYNTIPLDSLDLAKEVEVIEQSQSHKKMSKLIDQYVAGKRDSYSMKAAYIIRDTVKVLGADRLMPCSAGIFYDDLSNPLSGGTGHTMRVCLQNQIPVLDQRIWMQWLMS